MQDIKSLSQKIRSLHITIPTDCEPAGGSKQHSVSFFVKADSN